MTEVPAHIALAQLNEATHYVNSFGTLKAKEIDLAIKLRTTVTIIETQNRDGRDAVRMHGIVVKRASAPKARARWTLTVKFDDGYHDFLASRVYPEVQLFETAVRREKQTKTEADVKAARQGALARIRKERPREWVSALQAYEMAVEHEKLASAAHKAAHDAAVHASSLRARAEDALVDLQDVLIKQRLPNGGA